MTGGAVRALCRVGRMAPQPSWVMAAATTCAMVDAWLPPAANAWASASAAALEELPPSAYPATQVCLYGIKGRQYILQHRRARRQKAIEQTPAAAATRCQEPEHACSYDGWRPVGACSRHVCHARGWMACSKEQRGTRTSACSCKGGGRGGGVLGSGTCKGTGA